ncbi:septal ring lytic transglycosylase RlpA family protein [Pseudodesulfovibrio sp. F-1]|uniref:Probable endolytic peptidoglycan transglycosylase RlpA n=1 Tax=Pseudodesulfovibrio alkaliphilus TaxID=2661613 RepID=A0A7K1KPN7_9BACT|nr:septal ring lytic transglycosylase RlpA family protein [Pseudodesulfovibrio alkaliphilus]MUM78056.1 septal ring lytic transglycosylase RlpA family protein [Pseudodesulfovibrio alkaliphilus]
MRRIIALTLGLGLLTVAGCASLSPFPKSIHSTPPSQRDAPVVQPTTDPKTRPYTVMGRTYYPLISAHGYDEVGHASWYGKDFHGKPTANGQIYDMYGISAAHKLLPLGTRVRVTNLENGRTLTLVINDRGPFVDGRIIDLSYGAARHLGTVERGVVRVRVEAVDTVAPSATRLAGAAVKHYHVRVGAFAVRANADRVHRQLVESGYPEARVSMEDRNGTVLHVVQAGSFDSRDKAEQVLERLKRSFPTSYIVS